MAKTDMAVASAATLVAAQCVEAAESLGAERDHLAAAVNSAVNVKSHDDIWTLTAAAATALRGTATLKARSLKEIWNNAAVIPIDKGLGLGVRENEQDGNVSGGYYEEPLREQNFLGVCNQELLARGIELLKRTRNGDLHWKIVSVYIHNQDRCCVGGLQEYASMAWKALVGGWRATSVLWFKDNDTWGCRI